VPIASLEGLLKGFDVLDPKFTLFPVFIVIQMVILSESTMPKPFCNNIHNLRIFIDGEIKDIDSVVMSVKTVSFVV